ncbi:MAG: hypothetical protein FIB05_05740 [Betaproteobacteria bacterium]|nr:hypothetical protein [Betaproteobacteria bacterium]
MMRTVMGWPADKRRNAALGLLAAAVALALAIVALPLWLAHRHYDDTLEDIDRRLVRYERLAAARPALEKKLEAVRAVGSRKYFLKTGAASLSAAEIQDKVRQFVEGNGGRIISVQPVAPRDEGRFRQLTVTIQANASIVALRRILLQLETNEPYLFVDSLVVRSQVPPGFKPLPGMDPEMFVQFDITGFALIS